MNTGYFISNPFLSGPKFIEDPNMVDMVEDWSKVRSPSRARRRRAQGHKQNIEIKMVPKKEAISLHDGETYIIHPETARIMRQKIAEKMEIEADRQMKKAFGIDETSNKPQEETVLTSETLMETMNRLEALLGPRKKKQNSIFNFPYTLT